MQEDFKLLLADKINKYGLILSAACILGGLLFFVIKVWSLPPLIPLFYNRPWGMPQLGTWLNLLVVLLGACGLLLINTTLALRIYKNALLLARILIWVSTLVSLLAAVAAMRIIILVS